MNRTLATLLLLHLMAGISAQEIERPLPGYNPDSVPATPSDKDFERFSFFDRLHGFSGFDYSNKDLSRLTEGFMNSQVFNNHTLWPAKEMLPEWFDPGRWIERGSNPGLGIRKMHNLNIKGKGMSVAIIDKPINPSHKEFEGRLNYIEVFDTPKNRREHFHGIACASILAGSSCGILPEADIWYFAVPDDGRNSLNYLAALEKLIAVNDTLATNARIRAVSISDAIDFSIEEVASKWPQLIKQASDRGIAVICSDRASTHKYFTWGGSPPGKDPDNPESYTISPLIAADTAFYRGKILIPSDFRTTAANYSDTTFTYWGTGGFSWAIPWITGMLTAGWSINPDLTVEEMYKIMVTTGSFTSGDLCTISPEAFIREIKQ